MTKKATWSGYRGDGKPVIPCVPECMVEKSRVGEASRATRTPTDYKKPGKEPSSSPRKHMKRIRNEMLLDKVRPNSIFADAQDYFYHGMRQQKVAAVQRAYKAGDLDLLMTYQKYWVRKSFQSVLGAVDVLRAMGHTKVVDVVTDHHVDTFNEISTLVAARGYKPLLAMSPLLSEWGLPESLPAQDINEIVMIALTGKAENDAVVGIIRDREITDLKEIRKLVDEMLVDSTALGAGIL